MKVIRLTRDNRKLIVDRLMKRAFDDETAKLREDEVAFGKKVYADVYSPAVLKKMRALPEGYLLEVSTILVSFGGQVGQVTFGEDRRVAAQHAERYKPVISYSAQDPMSDDYRDFEARENGLKDRKAGAYRMAMAVLESVSTVKQLVEVWPEVAEVLGELGEEKSSVALAVPLADLNRQFGFVSEAKGTRPSLKEKVALSSAYGKSGDS